MTPSSAPASTILLVHDPFAQAMGVSLSVHAGEVMASLTLREDQVNVRGVGHGGLIMSLLDMTMGRVGRVVDESHRPSVTMEMKVTFLRPSAGVGHVLRARGYAVHKSRSVVFCEGEVLGGDGEVLARASGTFKYVNPSANNDGGDR